MNFEGNNIDELFKEQLGVEKTPFDPSALAGMEALREGQKGGLAIWGKWLIGSLTLLAVVGTIFWLKWKSPESELAEIAPTENTEALIINDQAPNRAQTVKPPLETQKIPNEPRPSREPSLPIAQNNQPTGTGNPENSGPAPAQKERSSDGPAPNKKSKTPEKVSEAQGGDQTGPVGPRTVQEPSDKSEATSGDNTKRVYPRLPEISILPLGVNLYAMEFPQLMDLETPKIERPRQWSLSVQPFVGVGHMTGSKETIQSENAQTESAPSGSQYLGLNIKANYRKWGISAGVQRQSYRYQDKIETNLYKSQYDTTLTLVSANYQVGSRTVWLLEETIDSTTYRSDELETIHEGETIVRYIQIPVGLSYDFQVANRWKLITSMGYRLNHFTSISGLQYNEVRDELTIKAATTFTAWTGNWSLGLGLEFGVTPQLGVLLQSSFLGGNVDQQGLKNQLNTNIGLSYKLF